MLFAQKHCVVHWLADRSSALFKDYWVINEVLVVSVLLPSCHSAHSLKIQTLRFFAVREDRSKYIMNTPFLAHSVQFHHITMIIRLLLIWIPIMGFIHYHLLFWIKFIIISTWKWSYNLLQLAVLTISVKTKSVHFFSSVVISIAYSKHFLLTTCPICPTSLLKTGAKIGARHSWE